MPGAKNSKDDSLAHKRGQAMQTWKSGTGKEGGELAGEETEGRDGG